MTAFEGNLLGFVSVPTPVKFVMKEGQVYRNDWTETNHHRD